MDTMPSRVEEAPKPRRPRRLSGSRAIDDHVGLRIRLRRNLMGMSQQKLGEMLGLTFQQIQKYERGTNRIAVGTLFQISRVLDVPISFFFDDMPESSPVAIGSLENGSGVSPREARLVRLWRRAPDEVAEHVLGLLSSLADAEDSGLLPGRGSPDPDGRGEAGSRRGRSRGGMWERPVLSRP